MRVEDEQSPSSPPTAPNSPVSPSMGPQRIKKGSILALQQFGDILADLPEFRPAPGTQGDEMHSTAHRDKVSSNWLLQKPNPEVIGQARSLNPTQLGEVEGKMKTTIKLRFPTRRSKLGIKSNNLFGKRKTDDSSDSSGRRDAQTDGLPAIPVEAIPGAGAFGSYRFFSKRTASDSPPLSDHGNDPEDDDIQSARPIVIPPVPIVSWSIFNPRYVHYRLQPPDVGCSQRHVRGLDMGTEWNDALERYQREYWNDYCHLRNYFGYLPAHKCSPYTREVLASQLEIGKLVIFEVSDFGSDKTSWSYGDELGPEWNNAIHSFLRALGGLRMREKLNRKVQEAMRQLNDAKRLANCIQNVELDPEGVRDHHLDANTRSIVQSLRRCWGWRPPTKARLAELERESRQEPPRTIPGWRPLVLEEPVEERVVRHDSAGPG